METEPGQKKHLFTNKQLWALLVPVVVEQILNSLMGTADTMMVSNIGSAAISRFQQYRWWIRSMCW